MSPSGAGSELLRLCLPPFSLWVQPSHPDCRNALLQEDGSLSTYLQNAYRLRTSHPVHSDFRRLPSLPLAGSHRLILSCPASLTTCFWATFLHCPEDCSLLDGKELDFPLSPLSSVLSIWGHSAKACWMMDCQMACWLLGKLEITAHLHWGMDGGQARWAHAGHRNG